MNKKIIAGIILSTLIVVILCACPNNCNGHGECNADSQCVCHKQQGLGLNDANFQLPLYTGADCSQRTCPTGVSFASFDVKSSLFTKVEAAGENPTTSPKPRVLFNAEEDRELDTNTTTTEDVDKEVNLGEAVANATVITNNINAPAFEKTTSKGGVMNCHVTYEGNAKGERMSLTVYGYQKTANGTVYVTDLPESYKDPKISDCYVTYVRRDLSLFGTIVFNNESVATWPGIGGILVNYGFASNTEYNIRVACVENAKTGIIRQLDNYVTMKIVGIIDEGDDSKNDEKASSYDVTFNLTENNANPAFCFILSTGTENGRVMHIDMISSELSMMIGKDGSNYYYGQKIEKGGVIQTVATPDQIVGSDEDTRRVLAATVDPANTIAPGSEGYDQVSIPEGSFRYYFDFSAIYDIEGKETSTKRDYSGFVRFLTLGSKATIIAQPIGTTTTTLSVTEVQVTKNPVEVVCDEQPMESGGNKVNSTLALKPQSNTGCFYLFFDKNTLKGKTGKYILNVFVSPSGVHPVIECSGNGLCNRQTGQCQCYPGYDGDACQRFSCPNDCSNHGRCVQVSDALGTTITAANYPNGFGHSNSKDLKYSMFACICDRGHRGPDCSLLECPSHDDPSNRNPDYKEKRDCSGRGICNYQTGNCECFQGFYGTACETASQNM